MDLGTSLPRIRVEASLVTFKWLKDQNRLKTGSEPSCVKLGEVFPDFTETATLKENMPHFSEDGAFIHELQYYLPGAYCVDGEVETELYEQYEEEEEEQNIGDQSSYIKVILCEEKGESMGGCRAVEQNNCYNR